MKYLSLFSGMEAAGLAWGPLGWECVAVSEIDPSACALLAQRMPHAPNLGSVTDITGARIRALGRLDVVIGGSPCQDLSIAGKRAGLGGVRSGLFHEQLRIFNAARTFCGARWLVWENVPGSFSTNEGRDFAVVVGSMAGCELIVPKDGWGNEGMAVGENGLVEWGVLDAQWFGVAQRRNRVFAVLDTGDWASRPPVLLESESLRGDSAPCRKARKDVAPCLSARTSGGGGLGTDFDLDGGLIHEVAGTLSYNGKGAGSATQQDAHAGMLVAFGGNNTSGPIEVSTALSASGSASGRQDFASETFITHATNPDEPYTLAIRGRGDSHDLEFRQDGTANALLLPNGGRGGIGVGAIAFDCKSSGQNGFGVGEIASTMRSMGHAESHQNGGGHLAVAFAQNQRDEVREMEVAGALAAEPGMKQATYLKQGLAVRRLTPRECERLQGAEDDWTLVLNARGKPMADGPRYKMLGNSFAVPCITWIGKQIQKAHYYNDGLGKSA